MDPTLGDVSAKKNTPSAEAEAAKEFLKLASDRGLSLTGPDGLLKQFTKNVLETALSEETRAARACEEPSRVGPGVGQHPQRVAPEDGADRSHRSGAD